MKIKYTSGYDMIEKRILEYRACLIFKRNEWKEVPDKIAEILLKEETFISEQDFVFDKKYLKTSNLNIGINRFGALGDLIMLLPVIRYLKRITNNKFHLITQHNFVPIFQKEISTFTTTIPYNKYKRMDYDKVVYLDGVLENDHSLTNNDRLEHRVKLYEKFFGIDIDFYDFHLTLDDSDIRFGRNLINACCKQNKMYSGCIRT